MFWLSAIIVIGGLPVCIAPPPPGRIPYAPVDLIRYKTIKRVFFFSFRVDWTQLRLAVSAFIGNQSPELLGLPSPNGHRIYTAFQSQLYRAEISALESIKDMTSQFEFNSEQEVDLAEQAYGAMRS